MRTVVIASSAVVISRNTPVWFGNYKLIERIAVGGMAEVFLAVRPGLEGFEKTVNGFFRHADARVANDEANGYPTRAKLFDIFGPNLDGSRHVVFRGREFNGVAD